tara:strand:- start:49 stop:615 length:567 start_codon:yes stop_codon:yes gene_type:complete
MNEKIELWFPTPIYYVDNLFGKKYNQIKQIFDNHNYDTARDEYFNVDTSYKKSLKDQLHHIEKFKPVFDVLNTHVYRFAKHLGYTNNPNLDTSWVNKSTKDDYLYPHVHETSLISGAYYVKANPDDKIHFKKNIMDMKQPPIEQNNINQTIIEYPCVSDRLILFFSDTIHMTLPQKAKEKMTLSFNYK